MEERTFNAVLEQFGYKMKGVCVGKQIFKAYHGIRLKTEKEMQERCDRSLNIKNIIK